MSWRLRCPLCSEGRIECSAALSEGQGRRRRRGNLGPQRRGTRNALVAVRTPTAEQSLLKRRQEAGCNTVFVPDTNPASELNQKSLNKYSSPFQFLESGVRQHVSFPSLDWLQL